MSAGRRLIIALLVIATLPIGVAALALIALQTSWARGYLVREAERRAERALGADVSIGTLGGTLLFGASVDDVAVARGGERLVAIDRVRLDYDLAPLLAGRFDIERVELQSPVIGRDAFGMFGALGGGRPGTSGRGVAVDEVVVRNGHIAIGPMPAEIGGFRVPDVIRNLDADLSLATGGGATTLGIERLSFTGVSPHIQLRSAMGTVVIGERDLVLDDMQVRLEESSFEFGGTIENFRNLGDS